MDKKPQKITSVENPLVKHWVKLREDRSYREEQKVVVVSSEKMVREIMTFLTPVTLFVLEGNEEKSNVASYVVTEKVLKKITGLKNPEKMAAVFPMPEPSRLDDKNFILALDEINDPGNLGTLLRSLLSFGWEGVYLTPKNCDLFNEKALRASRGASFSIPFHYGTIEEILDFSKKNGFTLYIANIKGEDIKQVPLPKKCILVLSNEARGLNQKWKEFGKEITIPIKTMDSLNVAVAGSLLMYSLKS